MSSTHSNRSRQNEQKEQNPGIDIDRLKKLIAEPDKRIDLHELVHAETEKLYTVIKELDIQNSPDETKALEWLKEAESASKNLRTIFAYGCYFGRPEHAYLWSKALNRLSKPPETTGSTQWLQYQLYPALLVFYSGGIAALDSGNYQSLSALFDVAIEKPVDGPVPLPRIANPFFIPKGLGNKLFRGEKDNYKTPFSDHVFELFNSEFPETLIFEDGLEESFDQWELLVSMAAAEHELDKDFGRTWAPAGRFAWRNRNTQSGILEATRAQLDKSDGNWLPFKSGLFQNSTDRAKQALQAVENIAEEMRL